jgi:hypothetical protein
MKVSQAGPVWLTGLLANGLKMVRGSLVTLWLLIWRITGGRVGDWGYPPLSGDDKAAWRRREGVRERELNLGETNGPSGGLAVGEGE